MHTIVVVGYLLENCTVVGIVGEMIVDGRIVVCLFGQSGTEWYGDGDR